MTQPTQRTAAQMRGGNPRTNVGAQNGSNAGRRQAHPAERHDWLQRGSGFLNYCEANREHAMRAAQGNAIAAHIMRNNIRKSPNLPSMINRLHAARQISRAMHLAGQRQFEAAKMWVQVAALYRGMVGEPGTNRVRRGFDPTK